MEKEIMTIQETPQMEVVANDPMMAMIERVVLDQNVPIEKLEKLMDLQERSQAMAAQKAYASAFAAASAEMPIIPMNGSGHNNAKYATLEDIVAYTRPVLSQHGLALNFSIKTGDTIEVTARLMHRDGHVESTMIALPRDTSGSKNNVQAVGSTQKYGQRYAAQAILGLSLGKDDEDDGRGASPQTETINAEQFVELRNLISRAGIDESVVLEAAQVGDLHFVLASAFPTLKKRLNKTIEEKKTD